MKQKCFPDGRQVVHGCQPKIGKTPKMDDLFHGKPYFLMDVLGVPLFLETPTFEGSLPWKTKKTTQEITGNLFFLVG